MRSKIRLSKRRVTMPARWQSSQRPLFVRTVWVNGLRHAILSADDPLLQFRSPAISTSGSGGSGRPGSCSSVGTITSSSSGSGHHCGVENTSCELEHCLIKLQLVIASNKNSAKSNKSRTSSSHRSSSSRSQQTVRHCCEDLQDSGQELIQDVEENNSVTPASLIGHYRRPYLPCVFPSSSEDEQEILEDDRWMLSDVETLLPDIQLNPLSERVLQWLDLAKKSAGIMESNERNAPLPCCEKRNAKERPKSQYFKPPRHPSPADLLPEKKNCPRKLLQKQRSADANSKVSTVAVQSYVESASNSSVVDDPLRVTARGMKTLRKKRSFLDNVRAVIDETVRCDSSIKESVQDATNFQQPNLPQPPETPPPAPSPQPTTHSKSVNRPQLHIFMPTLQKDRTSILHQDAAETISECESYWSET